MANKRAYSTYLSSTSAGPLVTANGFDVPTPQVSCRSRSRGRGLLDASSQTQAQLNTPLSISRLRIPGGWPDESSVVEDIAPTVGSLIVTFRKWAVTASIATVLSLPTRLAKRFWRQHTIKAVPIVSSNGSNKKRFIAAGFAGEIATPSPSVRARENQARGQNLTRATAASPLFAYNPFSPHQTTSTPSPVTYLTPPSTSPGSLYAPDDEYDEDISMEFEFDNMLFSTPPRNPQTGSPIHIPFDSPRPQSPCDQTPFMHLQYDSPAQPKQFESPAKLPWDNTPLLSLVGRPSPAPASTPCPKQPARSVFRIGRGRPSTRDRSSLTPMRRQLVKMQLGAGSRRVHAPQEAEGQTIAPEEGFTETEAAKNPTESDLSYLPAEPSSPFQTDVESPLHQPTPDRNSVHDEIELGDPSEYANDLSWLEDAPSPPKPRGVRWTKHADVKNFFYDAKVADMLDETLESINSEHETSFSFWHGRGRQAREDISSEDDASSPSPPASPVYNDDIDNSLEESMISDELLENLHEAFRNKIALEAAAAPPPPPPAPLVTPLSPEELETLKAAAAETSNGRLPNKWVIEEKLYARDFATLLPRMFNGDAKAWLNDNIVNEYLAILVAAKKKEHGFEHKRGGPAPPVHAFSSFWYETANVSRWAARFQLQGAQYLDAQLVLYPICHKGHWRLLAVYPQDRYIEYLDSLGMDDTVYMDKLKERLQSELGAAFIRTEWTQGSSQLSTQQMNGSDCGVFTVLNALALLRGDESERVLADNGMNDARQRIAATLLAGRPTTEF
jgi:hypothetical protein